MSISSIAQESALRLAPGSSLHAHRDAIAQRSAQVAVDAIAAGATPAQAATQGAAAGATAEPQAAKPSVNSNVLSQLVKYVPTEAITIYIAILAAMGDVEIPAGGKIHDADFTSRWLVVLGVALATLLMTLGLAYRAQKNASPSGRFKVPFFDIGAASAAFAVWALSLPSTPLRGLNGYDYSNWNPVLILVGTAAITFVAYVFNKTVAWEKFLQDGQ